MLMRHVTYVTESRHKYAWVMAHVWLYTNVWGLFVPFCRRYLVDSFDAHARCSVRHDSFIRVACLTVFVYTTKWDRATRHVHVCCSVLQCVAVCCSVLQCVAVCCSRLHDTEMCVVVCCSVLQRVAVCRSVLQCVAVWHTTESCTCNLPHSYARFDWFIRVTWPSGELMHVCSCVCVCVRVRACVCMRVCLTHAQG